MSARARFFLGVLLVLLAPVPLRADEKPAEAPPSPVGLWRLDRETLDADLDGDPAGLLKSLLIPDIELRVFANGRYETWTKVSGISVHGQASGGTWTQSDSIVSLAGIRDDGHPGSVIARLKDDRLVMDMAGVMVPLTRVSEEPGAEHGSSEQVASTHGACAKDTGAGEQDEKPGAIGLGPGPSIELPRPANEAEAWPPRVITLRNRRTVAKRLGAEVVAAVAEARSLTVHGLWKDASPKHVVYVQSTFDKAEVILDAWKVPHRTVSPRELLAEADEILPKARVILIPCLADMPPSLRTGLGLAARKFVGEGGRLATTDWSVQSVLLPAFPELVATKGVAAPLPELLCRTWIPADADEREPAFVAGIPLETKFELWCDQAAFAFELTEPASCVALMESKTLELAAEGGRLIAFSARHEKGKLLHAVPHLYQKRGTLEGARALQRLFLNFVMEGLDAGPDDS